MVSRQVVIIGSSAQKNLAGGATGWRACTATFRRRKPAGFIGRRARTGSSFMLQPRKGACSSGHVLTSWSSTPRNKARIRRTADNRR